MTQLAHIAHQRVAPTTVQKAHRRAASKRRRELEQALVGLEQAELVRGRLAAATPTWLPAADKAPLREQSAQVEAAQALVNQLIPQALGCFESLLRQTPSWSGPRRELADLCWKLHRWAETRGEDQRAARFLERLATCDDPRYVDLVEGTATLEIDSDPDGAEATLYPISYDDDGLRRLGEPRALGQTPVAPMDVAPGTYLLELVGEGLAPTRRPLRLSRGSDLRLHLTLFRQREVGPDFAYIPAGRAIVGGDPEASGAGSRREVFVDNFALAKRPVTLGEYRRFLDALADEDPGQALAFAPRRDTSAPSDPALPVTGIDARAAEAYCRWRSHRDGVAYRLAGEDEWEKAARGVDGRPFVWGERFDATFCVMGDSQPTEGALQASALVDTDESIYGVRDLAGGVAEWTGERFDAQGLVDAEELRVVRGGAFCDGAEACRVARRRALGAHGTATWVGFRLLRELAGGGGEELHGPVVPELPEAEVELDEVEASSLLLEAADDHFEGRAEHRSDVQRSSALLARAVTLLGAERGLWLRGGRGGFSGPWPAGSGPSGPGGPRHVTTLSLEASCSASGEPLPDSDRDLDDELLMQALTHGEGFADADGRALAVPVAGDESCLLFERRFARRPFGDTELRLAQVAADLMALLHD